MNRTKKKIILAAIELFNERGLVNVRNQDIAAAAGISLSNYNYHYGTKRELVIEVIKYMQQLIDKDVYGSNVMLMKRGQGFTIAQKMFEFEKKFRFFYLDTNNIIQTYPEVKKALQKHIQQVIQMIKNLHFLSIGKGLMKPPPPDLPDLYDHLAHQIWMSNHFWFAQHHISGLESDIIKDGLRTNFYMVYPYLTDLGKSRFKEYLSKVETMLSSKD